MSMRRRRRLAAARRSTQRRPGHGRRPTRTAEPGAAADRARGAASGRGDVAGLDAASLGGDRLAPQVDGARTGSRSARAAGATTRRRTTRSAGLYLTDEAVDRLLDERAPAVDPADAADGRTRGGRRGRCAGQPTVAGR